MSPLIRQVALYLSLAFTWQAHATFWSISLPSSSSGTFTATESDNNVTLNGTYSRLANSFIRLQITSSSGVGAPANGTVKYAFEVPGFALFSQPLLTTETQIVSTVVSGSCPTAPLTGLLTFALWASGTTNNVSSAAQPAFGTYTWNPNTSQMTISQLYNLSAYTTSTGFSSFALSGTCTNGRITFSGPGDRGGTMYLTAAQGAVFRTNAGKAVFSLPQASIPNISKLAGSYAVFNYDNAASQTIKPIRLTISGSNGSGHSLNDIDNEIVDSGDAWSLSGITINNPVNGMFTASLQRNSSSATRVACSTYLRNRTVIFCAAQSTSDASRPMNFAMVSDSAAFTGGTLDTYALTGGLGYTPLDFGIGNDVAVGLALDASGRITLGGTVAHLTAGTNIGLARYLADGSVDTDFGSSGKVSVDISSDSETVEGIALQSDEKLVVAGYTSVSNPMDSFVARFTAAGALDSSFASTGYRFASVGSFSTTGRAVALTSGGEIYVGGNYNNGSNTDFFLARYRSNGTNDTSFNSVGYLNSGIGGTGVSDTVGAMAVDASDRAVLVGCSNSRTAIARFATAGSLDSSFNSNGKSINSVSGSSYSCLQAVAIQPDGLIVTGGYAINGADRIEMQRFTAAGALDTNFRTSGRAAYTFASSSGSSSLQDDRVEAIAIQNDGKIIGFGSSWNGSNTDTLIFRLTATGAVDTSFNSTGYLRINQGNTEAAYAGAIQADTKYVFAGSRKSGSYTDFNWGRVWP